MSPKKKPVTRPTSPAKPKHDELPQTDAARKAAEAELRALITKFASKQLKLVTAVRKAIQKRLPTAHEVVYEYRSWFVISYSPSGHGYEGVFAIRGDANGVRFYFNQGKDLPDPEKLLKGSAQTRYIDLERATTIKRPAVSRLIEAAIARNRIPFAPTARGAILIRPTSAKKR